MVPCYVLFLLVGVISLCQYLFGWQLKVEASLPLSSLVTVHSLLEYSCRQGAHFLIRPPSHSAHLWLLSVIATLGTTQLPTACMVAP